MEKEQQLLFVEENRVNGVTAADYESAARNLEKFSTLMQAFYQRSFVIDFNKLAFMSVASTPFSLCGRSQAEVKSMGVDFLRAHIPQSEWKMITTKTRVARSMLEDIPVEERCECSVHFCVNLTKGKRKSLIGVTSIPLALTADGQPWLMLCVLCLSPGRQVPELLFKNNAAHTQMIYDFKRKEWTSAKELALTETEKWIILFACQGLPNKTICDMLDMSMDNVKKQRKQLFKKLGVKSIAEAIACVEFLRLL